MCRENFVAHTHLDIAERFSVKLQTRVPLADARSSAVPLACPQHCCCALHTRYEESRRELATNHGNKFVDEFVPMFVTIESTK